MKITLQKELYKSSGIYCIKSLIDDRLYIGSAVHLKKRFNDHNQNLSNGKHKSPKLQNFVNKYGIEKLCFQLLELCKPEDLITTEQKWIDLYNNKNILFNSCKKAGNTLGYKHTPEALEKMKNKKVSDETKQKQSEWQKGKSKPEELKAKWSDGRRKGKKKSEEFKKTMSAKMKGNKNAVGVVFSEERKNKIRENNSKNFKGKKLSEEHKKKISETSPFKGKPRSEEYKRKMSESCKKRFNKPQA